MVWREIFPQFDTAHILSSNDLRRVSELLYEFQSLKHARDYIGTIISIREDLMKVKHEYQRVGNVEIPLSAEAKFEAFHQISRRYCGKGNEETPRTRLWEEIHTSLGGV